MESEKTEGVSPVLVVLLILAVGLFLAAIGPIGRQNIADQEKNAIRRELVAHSYRIDPRPSCAGTWGKELQDLATAEGYC